LYRNNCNSDAVSVTYTNYGTVLVAM